MSNTSQTFAKQLRSNMTDAEKLLWYHLRGHRFFGTKFKRQQPLGNYIVDFVCFDARLVIEVDGGQHLESESDKRRDSWLRDQGFEVLRVWNNEVLEQTDAVLKKILQLITPSPQPSPSRGEGVGSPLISHEGGGEEVDGAPPDHPLSPRGRGLGRGGKNLERVRWRIRRGLLELDIVLGRFVEAHYEQLDEVEKQAFEVLLDMPDTVLWDMITGRQETAQSEQQALLEKIKVV